MAAPTPIVARQPTGREAKVVAGIASSPGRAPMAAVYDPSDPLNMTPEARVAELAALLAEGVLRLRQRSALTSNPTINPPPESPICGLDVCPGTSLHGHHG